MRPDSRPVRLVTAGVAILCLGLPGAARGQAISETDRAALANQVVARGATEADVDRLLEPVDEAAAAGLPAAALLNKIREGLAKGIPVGRIEPVVRSLAASLATADALLAELRPADPDREAAVAVVAEALSVGTTADEIRELARQTGGADVLRSADGLAHAIRALAYVRDAQLPAAGGTALLAEAVRQGYTSYDLLDLGAEVKRREPDLLAGRETLAGIRDAVARGERPERPARIERPAAPAERPVRPETPTRPGDLERPTVPERPAAGR